MFERRKIRWPPTKHVLRRRPRLGASDDGKFGECLAGRSVDANKIEAKKRAKFDSRQTARSSASTLPSKSASPAPWRRRHKRTDARCQRGIRCRRRRGRRRSRRWRRAAVIGSSMLSMRTAVSTPLPRRRRCETRASPLCRPRAARTSPGGSTTNPDVAARSNS